MSLQIAAQLGSACLRNIQTMLLQFAFMSMALLICNRKSKEKKKNRVSQPKEVPIASNYKGSTIIPDVMPKNQIGAPCPAALPGSEVSVEPIWTDQISNKKNDATPVPPNNKKSSQKISKSKQELKVYPSQKSKKKSTDSRPSEIRSSMYPNKSKAVRTDRTPPSDSVEIPQVLQVESTQESISTKTEDDDDTCKNADSVKEDAIKSKSSRKSNVNCAKKKK
ncbi:hypothetical protein DdX_01594 [Ditylenchus destructor]|uniref:Uncharacterized protein n=1 Tax=Ditylenchus destructor TaxID=166010 RepID=A0AAD4NFX0_9BILA|nr:hypothetical protein DdX_01594 [Ditylenchus destructor]